MSRRVPVVYRALPRCRALRGCRHLVVVVFVTMAGLAGLLTAPSADAQPAAVRRGVASPGPLAHPVAVFGADDRLALPPRHQDLRGSIGLLFSPKARTMCTAFCVADDVVASAAHCLFRTAGDPLPRLEDFRFARIKDDARTHARIAGFQTRSSGQHVVAGSMRLSVKPPIDATRDWALARLATPVCRGKALPLAAMPEAELAKAGERGALILAGYHKDFSSWRLALSPQCEIKPVEAMADSSLARDFVDVHRLILHTCDTGGASSGAPLILETQAGPVVVGINVGTYVQSKVMMQNGEVVHRYKAREIANTAASIAAVAEALPKLREAAVPMHLARRRGE